MYKRILATQLAHSIHPIPTRYRFAEAVAAIAFAALVCPNVASANQACLQKLYDEGKKISGADVDRGPSGEIMVLHPTKASIGSLWLMVRQCLDAAYSTHDLYTQNSKFRMIRWFEKRDEKYNWCVSEDKGIDRLGGNGPQRDWYAIVVRCVEGGRRIPQAMWEDAN